MTLQPTRPTQHSDQMAPIGGNETAGRAIAFARKHNTSLTPEVYHVWYTCRRAARVPAGASA